VDNVVPTGNHVNRRRGAVLYDHRTPSPPKKKENVRETNEITMKRNRECAGNGNEMEMAMAREDMGMNYGRLISKYIIDIIHLLSIFACPIRCCLIMFAFVSLVFSGNISIHGVVNIGSFHQCADDIQNS